MNNNTSDITIEVSERLGSIDPGEKYLVLDVLHPSFPFPLALRMPETHYNILKSRLGAQKFFEMLARNFVEKSPRES